MSISGLHLQGTFVVELTIGLVSVGLSILFYVMAARSQRQLNQVAARINTNVDDLESTLHRYRDELALARQAASTRGLSLTLVADATRQARAITARDVLQAVTELGKDWWHLREERLSLRREGVLAFADPLTPETRIELRSP